MYKKMLAALLLALTLGVLCPVPANATDSPGTASSYRHHRHRRWGGGGGPVIIIGLTNSSSM
jgi:hypothetical protein